MSGSPALADCWFLTGPTASGKTAVGLELAEMLGAEILSLDSMALYRRLDIGTAKPTAAERRRVPHHFIDVLEANEEFSLAQYVAAAEHIVQAVRARQREPLFVGGTPLYLKSLLRGIFHGPPADWRFRQHWQQQAAQYGDQWLHQRVAQVDPVAAGRLHARDTRRLIRALEVFEKTGRPISYWQSQFEHARAADQCRVFVLDWPREQLAARIDRRVEAMFAAGLLDEVRTLAADGIELGRTARQALGYREVLAHLQGAANLAETIELVKTRTRQFAKRQLTWFRSLSECRWVPMTENFEPRRVAEQIAGAAA